MPRRTFNISKGHVNEYVNRVATSDPANAAVVVVVLAAAQADDDLEKYETLADLLANAGNTESAFTNYARKVLTTVSPPAVDHVANVKTASIGDQTWQNAGGTDDESTVKIVICYDPNSSASNDANIVPMTFDDFVATTNGQDLTALEDENGFFRAKNSA